MLFAVALSRPQNGEWTDRKKTKYGIAQPLMGNGWRHCLFLLLNRNGSIVDRRLLLLRTVHHLTKMQLCNWRVSLCRRTFFGHLLSVDRASESEFFACIHKPYLAINAKKKTHKYLLSSKTITTNQRHLYFCLIFSNAAKCCGFSGRFYLSLSMSAFALRDQRSTNNLLNCTQVFFVLLLFSFTAAQTLCSRTKRYLYWNKSHIQMHCIGAQMKASKKKKKLSDILANELQRRAMWQMCWACRFAFFFNTSASTTNNNESKNEGKIEIARACKRDAIAIADNNKHNE